MTRAEITGDKRWSYESLLPYFKRTENYLGKGSARDRDKTLVNVFLEAAKELDYPITDLNAPFDEGFNEHCFNSHLGQRVSSYHAFLRPIEQKRKDRLTIQKFSTVTKVLIDNQNNAYGVQYEHKGHLHKVRALREVILSAGAIGSPMLLLHSGIGPSEHLQQVGIKPRVNLAGVGKNLLDHVSALVGPFTITNESFSQQHFTLVTLVGQQRHSYLASGDGPLAQSGSMASGFILSNKSFYTANQWPDIQLLLLGIPQDDEGLLTLSKAFNIDAACKAILWPNVNRDSFSIMTIVSRPSPGGKLSLASNNPFDPP
ncbi:hypothetical protein Ocin01_04758, partial [Orchesella cincta]